MHVHPITYVLVVALCIARVGAEQRLLQSNVCVGARANSHATVPLVQAMTLDGLLYRYRSGVLSCGASTEPVTWGCGQQFGLYAVADNNLQYPPLEDQQFMYGPTGLYSMPFYGSQNVVAKVGDYGTNGTTFAMIFPEKRTFYSSIRIYYAEDYLGVSTQDNSGVTCFDLYAVDAVTVSFFENSGICKPNRNETIYSARIPQDVSTAVIVTDGLAYCARTSCKNGSSCSSTMSVVEKLVGGVSPLHIGCEQGAVAGQFSLPSCACHPLKLVSGASMTLNCDGAVSCANPVCRSTEQPSCSSTVVTSPPLASPASLDKSIRALASALVVRSRADAKHVIATATQTTPQTPSSAVVITVSQQGASCTQRQAGVSCTLRTALAVAADGDTLEFQSSNQPYACDWSSSVRINKDVRFYAPVGAHVLLECRLQFLQVPVRIEGVLLQYEYTQDTPQQFLVLAEECPSVCISRAGVSASGNALTEIPPYFVGVNASSTGGTVIVMEELVLPKWVSMGFSAPKGRLLSFTNGITSHVDVLVQNTVFDTTFTPFTFAASARSRVLEDSRVVLLNCSFVGSASQLGDCELVRTSLVVQQCSFLNSVYGSDWNAPVLDDTRAAYFNCTFEGFVHFAVAMRGALMRNTTIIMWGSTFRSPSALGVFPTQMEHSHVLMQECTIVNRDLSVSSGLAVRSQVAHDTVVMVIDCHLEGLREDEGPGFAFRVPAGNGTRVFLLGNMFLNNTAEQSGGAIALHTPLDEGVIGGLVATNPNLYQVMTHGASQTYIIDNHFIGNGCVGSACQGGAIVMKSGVVSMSGCTVVGNRATLFGAGIAATGTSSLLLQDTEIGGNVPTGGKQSAQLFFGSTGALSMGNAVVEMTSSVQHPTTLGFVVLQSACLEFNLSQFSCPAGSRLVTEADAPFAGSSVWLPDNGNRIPRQFALRVVCQRCPNTTYSLVIGAGTATAKCLQCPFGASCRGGADVSAQPGFWGYVDNTALQFLQCPIGYCSSDSEQWSGPASSCASHRSGILCGECESGYSQSLTSADCLRNSSCTPGATVLFICFLFVVCALWDSYLLVRIPSPGGLMATFLFFYQVSSLLVNMDSTRAAVLRLFSLSQPHTGLCVFPSAPTVVRLWWKYVEALSLVVTLGVCYSLHHCWKLMSRKNVEVRERSATRLDMLVDQLQTRGQLKRHRYVCALVLLGMFSYQSITQASAQLVHCIDVAGVPRLYSAAGVHCYTPWQGILVAVLAMLCVVPVALAYWLWKAPSSLWPSGFDAADQEDGMSHLDDARLQNISSMATAQVLIMAPFRPQRRYWQAVLLLQLMLFSLLSSVVTDSVSRSLCLTTVALCSALVHLYFQPYRSHFLNVYQVLCAAVWVVLSLLHNMFATLQTVGAGSNALDLLPDTQGWTIALLSIPALLLVGRVLWARGVSQWYHNGALERKAAVSLNEPLL